MSISYRDQKLNTLNSQNISRKCFSEWMHLRHEPTWLLTVLWGFLCLCIFLSISYLFFLFWTLIHRWKCWSYPKTCFDKKKHNTLNCLVQARDDYEGLCCAVLSPQNCIAWAPVPASYRSRETWGTWFDFKYCQENCFAKEGIGKWRTSASTIPDINFASLHVWYRFFKKYSICKDKQVLLSVGFHLPVSP